MGVAQQGEDYSVVRVPLEGKQQAWKVTLVRIGGFACVPQLMVGATLGFGLTFWQAVAATFFGSVLLQVINFLVGWGAAKEGLSTSMFSRWSGFGKAGASILSVLLIISTMGWFGIQNSVSAEGFYQVVGVLPLTVWCLIAGFLCIGIVIFGFKFLNLFNNIVLPFFVFIVLFGFFVTVSSHDIVTLINSPPPGPPMPMSLAITMVAGSAILGCIILPDLTRFLTTKKEVFVATAVSTLVGEMGFGLIGVLMAHAAKTSDVVSITLSLTGALGAAIIVFAALKVNNVNLYSGSLNLSGFIDAAFGIKLSRVNSTLILGVVGTILSVLGILNQFVNFLNLLGTLVPPIGGILIVDYYILKRFRPALDSSREMGKLPDRCEIWNPIAIAAWIIGFIVGLKVTAGIPSINSLVVSAICYYIIMKLYGVVTNQPHVEFKSTHDVL